MTLPDLINGSFEALAGVMVGNHCRTLYRQKKVRGVSLLSTCFFSGWGVWNLYYYPHLGQLLSFFGGLSIVTANTVWIGMMVYYRRQEQLQPARMSPLERPEGVVEVPEGYIAIFVPKAPQFDHKQARQLRKGERLCQGVRNA